MQSKKIIDKLTCRPVSKTLYLKYARHLPAHFCTPHTGQYNVTTQRTIEVNTTSHYHGEYVAGTERQTDGRQTVTLRFPLLTRPT